MLATSCPSILPRPKSDEVSAKEEKPKDEGKKEDKKEEKKDAGAAAPAPTEKKSGS